MVDDTPGHGLLARARAGDRKALGILLAREEAGLRSWLLARMGAGLRERVEVDDVLQETLAQAVRSFATFEERNEGSLLRWLCSIGAHAFLHAARSGRRRPMLALRHDVEARGVSPSRTMGREERFERLERALAKLPPESREVIRLARLEGLAISEIATVMGRSPAAVSMLLSRALKKLKQIFGDTGSLSLPDRQLERGGPKGERHGA